MQIKITQPVVFKTVSIHQVPDFFKALTDEIFTWLISQQVVIPETPYRWEKWKENLDTGIYFYAGRLTSISTYSDWIVEGFMRELSEYDEPGFVYTHRLIIQNAWRKVKIGVEVRLGKGVYEIDVDAELPDYLQESFKTSLLAAS
jgi:hypothetical protein